MLVVFSMSEHNWADLEAWEAYCEACLDLSNQDDVGEEQEVDEYGYPLKLGDFYAS